MTDSSIFHPGPLENAITDSMRMSRSLACFITDDNEESSKWEDVYLQNPDVVSVIQNSLVLIRLQAGSVEAGFLAAFCPIQAVPYLVVIKNGALVVNIAAGASEEEFRQAIGGAFVPTEQPATSIAEDQPPLAPENPLPIPSSSSSSSVPSSSPSSSSTAPNDRNAVYEARKARLEQKRAAEEKEEREKRLARRPSSTPDPAGRSSNMTYLEQQRKRQLAAQEERQRVLRLLENDRIERRQREAKRKQTLEEATVPSSSKESIPTRPVGGETAISFRLLDGSSLKAKFPSESILGTDVRAWLDENRGDGDHPYSFMQILAPLPNKPLSVSDENSPLVELGLSPTATLVLVPVQSYTVAYRSNHTSNEVGLLSKAYSMVYSAITTVLGVGYFAAPSAAGAATAATSETPVPAVPTPPRVPVQSRPGTAGGLPMSRTNSGSGRIRTLYDQRDESERGESERKYYNGNQLNFEPKPKDEKGKGKE